MGWLVADVTRETTNRVERNTKFVDRWTEEGRLLFLEDRVKRMDQSKKPSAWPAQVKTN